MCKVICRIVLKSMVAAIALMVLSACLCGPVFAADSTTVYCYQIVPGSETAPRQGEFTYGQGVDQINIYYSSDEVMGSRHIDVVADGDTRSCYTDSEHKYMLVFQQDGKTVLSYTFGENDTETNELNVDLSKKRVTRNKTEHYTIDPNIPSKLVLEDGATTSDDGGDFDGVTLTFANSSCFVAGDGGNKYLVTFHADGDDEAPWAKNGNTNSVVFKSGLDSQVLGTCGVVSSADGNDGVGVVYKGKQYTIPIKDGATSIEFGLRHVGDGGIEVYEISQPTSGFDTEEESRVDVEEVIVEDVPTDPVQATCLNSGAGETLGWILCPVLNFLSKASDTLYENYIEPALRVEPQIFNDGNSEGSQSGARYAWGIFQGIANTLFIILLLVVIFSQLTGVGIDNYGIKKILPKMIVVAILVNLSYIICLICVDLSNILGTGMQSLFNSISVTIPENLQVGGVSVGSIGTTALTGVALLGIFATGIWAVAGNGGGLMAVLLMLLVSAISIAVSIFFLFILLAAREAAIIVLTIISPLAFVCYMLPNTKKFYDKWFQAWEALLLLYPICGALIGGGNFVSRLLIASGAGQEGFFTAFMAMIIGVVPIFFIPTLLKNSMAALGGLGAKISGVGKSFGNKLSGNTEKSIRGSKRFQERQQYNQEQSAARRAMRIKNRLGGRDNLSRRQMNRLRLANEQYLESQKRSQQDELGSSAAVVDARLMKQKNAAVAEQAEAGVGVYELTPETAESRARAAKEAQETRAYQDQYAGYSRDQLAAEASSASSWLNQPGGTQRMSALLGAMEGNGLENDIFNMLRSNNVSDNAAIMSALSASKNKVLRAYGKNGAGVAYNDYMTNGGMKSYIDKKTDDFIDGIDDKALSEIANYENGTYGTTRNMSTDVVMKAAAKPLAQESINQLDEMIEKRDDIKFTADQYVKFNDSTINAINNRIIHGGAGATNALNAVLSASDNIVNDQNLRSKITNVQKATANTYRRYNGRTTLI